MAITGLDIQFRFQRLRKKEERRAKDRTPLFMKLPSSGSGRKAFPRTLPFIALSGLWSLGNQVFHLIQCISEKKKKTRDSLGRKKGKWILVGIGHSVFVYRGKSRKPESRGAESRECQQDILIRFRQNNLSLLSILGLFNNNNNENIRQ